MSYDLSIVLPSIRTNLLPEFYNSIINSTIKHSFELIVIGPYNLPRELERYKNIKYIRDFGSPSRCAQIGVSLAEGKMMTWGSDDGLYENNALSNCIDLLKTKTLQDGIIIQYTEGLNRQGPEQGEWYYIASKHGDQKLAGVKLEWKTAPLGMYYTDYFLNMGGWDCSYEHLNFNCHDFAFRLQNDGGSLYYSPDIVLRCDWMEGRSGDHGAIADSYHQNDLPLYQSMYSQLNNRVTINFDNWKKSPKIWRRFN